MNKISRENNIIKLVLKEALETIRKSSDYESIAIRLEKEGDFPYFLQIGFTEGFVEKENTLNIKDKEGNLVLEDDGTPFVECMCGNVLRKRVYPNRKYFTKEGAFWTNSTTQLLGSLTEAERKEIGRTRNTCHDYGYESVALIPIHASDKIIGLIQINDSRRDKFTAKKIVKFQVLADLLGTVITNILEFYKKAA